jgi:hypothetical protein
LYVLTYGNYNSRHWQIKAIMLNASSQSKFDKRYITAAEITKELGISRAGFLYGRRHGKLPEPVIASEGRLMMWERTPEILACIASWKEAIASRKAA